MWLPDNSVLHLVVNYQSIWLPYEIAKDEFWGRAYMTGHSLSW
jgi:hypothetical protein